MKAIQNCLQKIVIYKIYSLEKQKMEYNDNEVYNHIGVGFLIVFSYIVIILLFLSVRLFNELRNNSTLIVCVTILCCKHSIFRHDNFIGCFSADKIKMSARKYFCFNIPIDKNMAEGLFCRSPYHEEYIQTSASGNPEDLCH